MESLDSLVDLRQTSLLVSLLSILFNPIAWNIVAQNEYRNKTITRIFGGNARNGCYFLAVLIFSFGILRDSLCVHIIFLRTTNISNFIRVGRYHRALADQPKRQLLPAPLDTVVPTAMFLVGQTFVVTSTWALGVTGTFLGDYFGILMDHRVEGFPFNALRDPMYVGSTLSFAATALWYERPAGLFITLYVYIIYVIALRFEGPFTDMIYARREAAKKKT
ncbi:phospholipid methyltransferase-domain-containing protein [Mycena sp. CBHHK59/15]|nr:phospholipid methyltransferase-domain-containing protein [Mycena sp. CBHHK59/15]